MFLACGIWCLADVLSVSPLLEQTERDCGEIGYGCGHGHGCS